jgi:hypothetical protein
VDGARPIAGQTLQPDGGETASSRIRSCAGGGQEVEGALRRGARVEVVYTPERAADCFGD